MFHYFFETFHYISIPFQITHIYIFSYIIKFMPFLFQSVRVTSFFLVGMACANRNCGCVIASTTAVMAAMRNCAVSMSLS